MNIGQCKKKSIEWGRFILVAAIFLFLQQFQLTVCLRPNKTILFMNLKWVLLNMAIVSIPFFTLLCFVRRLNVATILTSILFTLLSLINYHVLAYHGAPFFAEDIFSIGTALNVAGGYKYLVNKNTNITICIFLIEAGLWLILNYKANWFRRKGPGKVYAIPLLANTLLVYILLLSPLTLFPQNLISWSWAKAVPEYGYGITLCNSAYSMTHMVSEPEGYNVDTVMAESATEGNGNRPDIIIILNESLYDINQYADLPESEALFQTMDAIAGVIRGNSVCSLIGGGTNNSEYELLLSNSMALLELSAPFSAMSMKNVNSIVSYLNGLDYTTVGMHCCNASNYARNRAYKELGFDHVVLGPDAFQHQEGNGKRQWLDSGNYQDMLDWYDSCDDGPRMMYLLTYQNHGGYEQNEESLDTIHIQSDQYGDLTDDINEFLSSLEKSVTAFAQLIAELNSRDRPVVLLMVGDHAPPFIREMQAREGMNYAQREIASRTVPYYIWSNISLDDTVISYHTTMTDLVPMVLKASGMPTSMYYETILEMNRAVPVRIGSRYYVDANGTISEFTKDADYYGLINNYYYMEYNNIMKDDDYNPLWFQITNS